jgi:Uma2 family endonuclease
MRERAPGDAAPPPEPTPLENGDHLTRAEFLRRYEAMPRLKKAELIEGVVAMGSPVRARQHGQPHARILTWLGTYEASTPGVVVADNVTTVLDPDNVVQPDAVLVIERSHGGQSTINPDGYIEGPPELAVEVAASTASFDLHEKLRVYRRNGVREYQIWRVLDQAIDWLALDAEGRYVPLPPDAAGRLESRAFPGLRLDPAALLRGDLAAVLEVLRGGLDSPEHAAFRARLQAAPGSS